MDATITSAIIAAAGVGLSGICAYWVAARQGAHRFNELLYQARLDCYPQLYSIASGLAKHLRYGTITAQILSEAMASLDDWDSQHALLLSPISVKAIFHLRFHLRSLDARTPFTNQTVLEPLLRSVADIENAIKTELGVYSLSDYHNPRSVRDVSKYIPLNANQDA
jgi:hypothetical protein